MKKYDCFQLDSICFALFNLWTNPQRSSKLNYVTEEVIFWYLVKYDETGPALTSLTSNNCWTNASLSRNRMNVEPVQHAHVPRGWMLTTLGGQLPAVALVSWQPPLVTTFICTVKMLNHRPCGQLGGYYQIALLNLSLLVCMLFLNKIPVQSSFIHLRAF